jgi:hypothetical protein
LEEQNEKDTLIKQNKEKIMNQLAGYQFFREE